MRCQGGGHWISTHGRYATTDEMLLLQNMLPSRVRLPETVTEQQLRCMIGNSMSVNIIGCVLSMLSRSVPSLFPAGNISERWSA
eukprot:3139579-Pyramimonas_sp.AAC.1